MDAELKEIYKMQKWSDNEIVEELSRPVDEPLTEFQKCLEREALRRILKKLCLMNNR